MTNGARAKATATPLFDSIRVAVFAAILGAIVAYAALAFLLLIDAFFWPQRHIALHDAS